MEQQPAHSPQDTAAAGPGPADGETPRSATGEVDLFHYAALVGKASDEEIAAAFARDREALLKAIPRAMEERFVPERAAGVETVLQWNILDRPGGGQDSFHLVIRAGTCRASQGPAEAAGVTMSIRPVPFVRLITGRDNPMKLFTFGKISISGDLALAARVSRFFELPEAPS